MSVKWLVESRSEAWMKNIYATLLYKSNAVPSLLYSGLHRLLELVSMTPQIGKLFAHVIITESVYGLF